MIPETNQASAQETQPKIQIDVDPTVLMALKTQEFDKKIAEAKVLVAELEKQKASFIYDTNIQMLINQAEQKKKQDQPVPVV